MFSVAGSALNLSKTFSATCDGQVHVVVKLTLFYGKTRWESYGQCTGRHDW